MTNCSINGKPIKALVTTLKPFNINYWIHVSYLFEITGAITGIFANNELHQFN